MCQKKKNPRPAPRVLAYFHLQDYICCHYVYSDPGVNHV